MKKLLLLLTCTINLTLLSNQSMQLTQGYLFVAEGTEGCGKTTFVKNLAARLSDLNLPVFTTREPGATELGKNLRAMLMNRTVPTCTLAEFLLFAADRSQHFKDFIIPHLEQNHIVISDRMADSSLVYQGHVKGLDQNFMKLVNQQAMQEIRPNLVFYLKIDAAVALERMHTRNEEFLAFEQEILEKKSQLVQGFNLILTGRDNVIVLDANLPADELADLAVQAILKYLQK